MVSQHIFKTRQEALLHGDLHTGSFMVTSNTTFAIDAEFAYYGPMAFDCCKMIANLLLAYYASFGLEKEDKTPVDRPAQRKWLLQVLSHQALGVSEAIKNFSLL